MGGFPADAVTQLKAAGHDIVWVRTAAPGMKDEDVPAWAAREARIVLTFDKDFGELAWRWHCIAPVANAARSGGRHQSCRPDC